MTNKVRLSASVDAELVAAGQAAVAAGKAENLSAWVNEALIRHTEHGRGLQALAAFVAEYEAEHGEISQEDMDAADRWARARAIVVRSGTTVPSPARRAV